MDTDDNVEETLDHISLPIKVNCNISTHFLVQSVCSTIAYVDPNVAGKMMGENNAEPDSGHWPPDDESILQIVASIVNMTILSIMNTAIAGLLEHLKIIQEVWCCWEESNGDGGLHAPNVTAIFLHNPAAGWVQAAKKSHK